VDDSLFARGQHHRTLHALSLSFYPHIWQPRPCYLRPPSFFFPNGNPWGKWWDIARGIVSQKRISSGARGAQLVSPFPRHLSWFSHCQQRRHILVSLKAHFVSGTKFLLVASIIIALYMPSSPHPYMMTRGRYLLLPSLLGLLDDSSGGTIVGLRQRRGIYLVIPCICHHNWSSFVDSDNVFP